MNASSPRTLSYGLSIFLCAAATVAQCLTLKAAPLADFTSGSYVAGPLSGQNSWAVQVQSPYNGTMTIEPGVGLNLAPTTNGAGGPIAYWGTASVFGTSVTNTNSISFILTEAIESVTGGSKLVSLHYELYKNAYGNSSPLMVNFSRIAGTSNYQLAIGGNAGGTVTGTTTVVVPGSALGLNYAGSLKTSQPMQLAFKLTRGATTATWTVQASLVNLVTLDTFTLDASVTGATAYYTSTLYPAIHNTRVTTPNGGLGDGDAKFTITAFGLNPLSTGGVGTAGLANPWQAQDLGTVGVAGSSSSPSGTFTVAGAGADIGGTADAYRFVYQGIRGGFDFKARVLTQGNTNSLAKAGIMIRNDLTAGAANVAMLVSPGSGWIFQRRTTAGGSTSSVATGGSGTAPLPFWIRLNYSGNVITGYRSTDGVNWVAVGSSPQTFGSQMEIGLAVSSHVAGTLSTATFDNVSVTVPVGLGAGPGGGTVPANATLTFSEDFSTGALNPAKWAPNYCNPGTINSELQVFLPEALTFPLGGGLEITATKPAAPMLGQTYVSGAMTTYGRFSQTYGYFECKAQIPKGRGLWPAFWLLPDNLGWPPEIDVMENLGQEPNKVYTTLHWLTGSTHYSDGLGTAGTDYSAGYHTYGVSWLPGSMTFYVDGVAVHTISGSQVPSTPMYMLLNLAVGGSWPGSPDASTVFPAVYKVAWVHAYQYNSAPAVASTPIVFGPTTLTSDIVHPGDTITVSSSVKAGTTTLTAPYLGLRVTGFYGTPSYTYTGKSVGLCLANTTTPFTVSYTVPTTMAPGIYTIWYHLDGSGQAEDLYCAKRFTVVDAGTPIATTLSPEADAYVRSGSFASSNFGSDPLLLVKNDGATEYTREAYLRFNLSAQSAPVSSAKLRLTTTAGVATVNSNLGLVANDTWTETGLTWSTKPASTTVLGSWLPQPNTEFEIDITSQVNAEIASDKKISFRLSGNTGSSVISEYGSKENTDTTGMRPALILTP